jgi:quercetin dioxygenase-like cupin family protein
MYKKIALTVFALFYFVIFSAVSLYAQDVAKVAPKNYKVLIDNDKVRVIDNISNAGEKSDWHSHPDMLVYVIEGGKTLSTTKDGKSETIVFKKGATLYRNAVTHKTENVGKTKLHLILVELKK